MRKALLIWLLLLTPFFVLSQSAEKACFSVPGGFYENTFTLELSTLYQQNHIRYTTNGNRPTAQSQLYTGPLLLDESLYSTSNIYTIQITPDGQMFYPDSIGRCIIIRASVFDENDSCISEPSTNSYFINALGCNTHGLPVVSLCADTMDLFDYQTGIFVPGVFWDSLNPQWTGNYYQQGAEWERIANVEFYETNNTGINQQCGLRTHGGNGRRSQQKGLKIYAREEYGKKRFEHRFFEDIPQMRFKHLVLKPFSSSWIQSGVANNVCNKIAKNLNVESLSDRAAVLFLNGEYWGIYYVHEKPDERYLQDHFDIDPDEINLMANWISEIASGTNLYFVLFRSWLQTADLSDPAQWDYVKAHVDIDCFLDYQVLELFLGNLDWPANNMRCWQHNDGLWRWIFYDGDACLSAVSFDVFANAVYVDPDPSAPINAATLYFRKFMENQEFRTRFYERFNELLDGVFQYSITQDYLIAIKTALQPEVPAQSSRFNFPESIEKWNEEIDLHRWFLECRVDDMRSSLNEYYAQWYQLDHDNEEMEWSVFPNPFNDRLSLRCDAPVSTTTTLQIFNLLGQQVYSRSLELKTGFNEIQLGLTLAPGMYMLKTDRFVTKIISR